MCMYAPSVRRFAYLLCFDPQRRLLLRPGRTPDGAQALTLPVGRCRERETYGQAVQRIVSGLRVRRGDVVARVEGPAAPGREWCEARIFTAHSFTSFADDGGRWFPWSDAVRHVDHLAIPELAAFVEGYLGGWIPEGWITLQP